MFIYLLKLIFKKKSNHKPEIYSFLIIDLYNLVSKLNNFNFTLITRLLTYY